MNKYTTIQLKALSLITILLSGCSTGNYRMEKHDPSLQASNDKAIVIMGTKNLTFIDFNKFVKHADKPITKKTDVIAAKQENISEPAAVVQKTNNEVSNTTLSADPNKSNYPSIKFSDVFKRKSVPEQAKRAAVANTEEAEQQYKYRVLKANSVLNFFSYANSVYSIEPGTYYISYVYSDEGASGRHTKLGGLANDGTVEYGAFTVKAGDIVYLGDIGVDWFTDDPAKMINISGDINNVKNDLVKAHQSDLAYKLQLATFLAGGTKINY